MLSQNSTHHDPWLVILAAVICVGTSLTTFTIYSHLLSRGSRHHLTWLLLTGFCAGAGAWATHFVAMLAYDSGLATRYNLWLTIASLVAAIVVTTSGLSISLRPGRAMVATGGVTIGLGVAAMHFLGVRALIVAGVFEWNHALALLAVLSGLILTACAMLAYREQSGHRALVSAAALFAAGICALHFMAMAALTIVPAPQLTAPASNIDSLTVAVAVTSMTALVLLAGYVAALVDGRATRDTFARMGELIDAAIEGLVITDNGVIINMNSRALELCGRKRQELIGKPILGDLLANTRQVGRRGANMSFEIPLLKADGTTIPVEVVRRQLHSLARGNEVYAIRDLRERNEAARQLEKTNEELKQKEQELRLRNLILQDALSNMSQGLCMYDKNQRVVISNERYATIYGLPGDAIQPGMSLQEVVQLRIDNGIYAGASPKDYLKERIVPVTQSQNTVQELNNGKVIAIARRPLRGGWVTTHEDVTGSRRMEAQITQLAHHDALTDLPNREALRNRLRDSLAAAGRHDCRVAILMLAIDRFNELNDTLGHEVGDELLKLVAGRLQNASRKRTVLGRFSDNKFVLAEVIEHSDRDSAALANRIQEEIRKPCTLGETGLEITAAIGISLFPADGKDADTLLKNAGLALYRAQTEGRGLHRFFEPTMDRELRATLALEQDLRKALQRREFELHYQPVVDLARSEITGFEALLRWRHPVKGFLRPEIFLPLAEEVGLINPIEEWTLQQACREATQWPRTFTLAVNLSLSRFRSPDLVPSIGRTLAATGLTADRLQIEVTEKVLHDNPDEALKTLRELHKLGVQVVLDDFGAGFSSLTYLRQFPFNKIKIDRSFVANLSGDMDCRLIVRTLARLGTGLRIATAAEGVETKEQLDIVRAEGCTEMQGHYFSAPKTAEEVGRLLLKPLGKVDAVA